MKLWNLTEFDGFRHRDSEDITFLICHVILQDHVIKGSCDLWVAAPHDKSPPCLGGAKFHISLLFIFESIGHVMSISPITLVTHV